MKLLSCHIENFGILHDVDFSFRPGLNEILDENGSGKSTLAYFLSAMFYGLSGDRKKDLRNERKRFAPWQGGVFGGSLRFSAGGKEYEVTRIFRDKEGNDSFTLRDLRTNEISSDFSEKLGEELFRLNDVSFRRSAFIGQNDLWGDRENEKPGDALSLVTDEIHSRIGESQSVENSVTAYEDANQRIHEAMKVLQADKGPKGRIPELRGRISDLQGMLRQRMPLLQKIEDLREAIRLDEEKIRKNRLRENELKTELDAFNKERLLLEKKRNHQELLRNYEEAKAEQEARNRFYGEPPEKEEFDGILNTERSIRILRGKESELEKKIIDTEETRERSLEEMEESYLRAKKKRFLLIPAAVLLVAGIVLFILGYRIPGIVSAVVGLLLSIYVIVVIIRAEKERKLHEDLRSDPEYLTNDRNELQRIRSEIQGKREIIDGFLKRFGESASEEETVSAVVSLRSQAERYIDAENLLIRAQKKLLDYERENPVSEYESVTPREVNILDVQREYEALRPDTEERITKNTKREIELSEAREELSDLEDREAELIELQEELKRSETRYSDLMSAREYLLEAKKSLTGRFKDPVLSGFRKYYSILTGRDGESLHLDSGMNVTFDEKGEQRNAALWSPGYRELSAVCLRLAFTDAMYPGEKPVLIMDDPFVNFDDGKIVEAAKLLRELSETYQVIYFTCSVSRKAE